MKILIQAFFVIAVLLFCSLANAVNYRILVGSDPQAWRLDNDDDPNSYSSKPSWDALSNKVAGSIRQLNKSSPIKFGIITGDITEFGRSASLDSFSKIYENSTKIGFPIYYGLGNHDYANNAHDCQQGMDIISKDGCAASMVTAMVNNMANNYSRLKNYSQDFIYTPFSEECDERHTYCNRHAAYGVGSMAYSWDDGDIHYVQLQNYPSYNATLRSGISGSYDIKSSLDWLATDLEKASKSNKHILLFFHDGFEHFSGYSQDKFISLITYYKVSAVFVGHLHEQRVYAYGNIPVFVAGALFKGDYYLVDIDDHGLTVHAFNGKSGSPTSLEFTSRVDFPRKGTIVSCKLSPEMCDKAIPISKFWPLLKDSEFGYSFDTAATLPNTNFTYLFRGAYYRKVDVSNFKPVAPSLSIRDHWNGFKGTKFESDITATISDLKRNLIFFIKDSDVAVYDVGLDKVVEFSTIAKLWPSLTDSDFGYQIDAAVNIPGTDDVYLFYKSYYRKFNIGDGTPEGQPVTINGNWKGLDNTDYVDGIKAAISDSVNDRILLYNSKDEVE